MQGSSKAAQYSAIIYKQSAAYHADNPPLKWEPLSPPSVAERDAMARIAAYRLLPSLVR